jgi:hypothetical protein
MKLTKTLLPILLLAIGLGCGYSKPSTATTGSGTPTINQLAPGSTTAGSAQFQLEVDGASFASNAFVSFNGAAQPTTFVNAGKLNATIPATAVMNAATVPVTVTNPGTTGIYGTPAVTSSPMSFTIN